MFIEALSMSFVMKMVFEHHFHYAIQTFVRLCHSKVAAMTSYKAKF